MLKSTDKEALCQFYLPEQDAIAFQDYCEEHKIGAGTLLREFVQVWNRTHLDGLTMEAAYERIEPTKQSAPFMAHTTPQMGSVTA